jgi:hypothetical protein
MYSSVEYISCFAEMALMKLQNANLINRQEGGWEFCVLGTQYGVHTFQCCLFLKDVSSTLYENDAFFKENWE